MRPLTPTEQLAKAQADEAIRRAIRAGADRIVEESKRMRPRVFRYPPLQPVRSYDDPDDDGGTVYVITTTDTRRTP